MDIEKINANTFCSLKKIENLEKNLQKIKDDKYKDTRFKSSCCRLCFYRNVGVVMHGFTEYTCEECGKVDFWHNSGVPKYCHGCGKGNHVCVFCGSDLSYNERR